MIDSADIDLPDSGSVLIVGPPKSGKTRLALSLALRLAQTREVLYVTDDSPREIDKRLGDIEDCGTITFAFNGSARLTAALTAGALSPQPQSYRAVCVIDAPFDPAYLSGYIRYARYGEGTLLVFVALAEKSGKTPAVLAAGVDRVYRFDPGGGGWVRESSAAA